MSNEPPEVVVGAEAAITDRGQTETQNLKFVGEVHSAAGVVGLGVLAVIGPAEEPYLARYLAEAARRQAKTRADFKVCHKNVSDMLAVHDVEAIKMRIADTLGFGYRGPRLLYATGTIIDKSLEAFGHYYFGMEVFDTRTKRLIEGTWWELAHTERSLFERQKYHYVEPRYGWSDLGKWGLPDFLEFALDVVRGEAKATDAKGIGAARGEFLREFCNALVWEMIDLAEIPEADLEDLLI